MSERPRLNQSELLSEIARRASAEMGERDAGHDVLHLTRVRLNARGLVDAERAAGREIDDFVVEAACWLHDLVQLSKGSGPAGEAARRSAAAARELLDVLGVDITTIDAIAQAVETHSFSGGRRPATLEAAIVQDADRLDALGAIGVARLFVTAAELDSRLYHASDPRGTTRELDDRAYALDHVERKLLKLPGLMNTVAGRTEAERRAEQVRGFRDELLRESGFDGG